VDRANLSVSDESSESEIRSHQALVVKGPSSKRFAVPKSMSFTFPSWQIWQTLSPCFTMFHLPKAIPHPKKSWAHLNRTFLGDEEVFGLQVSMTNHVHVDVGNSTPRRSAGKGPKETRERDRNFFEKVPESSSIPKSLDRLDSTKKESRNTCRVCRVCENNF